MADINNKEKPTKNVPDVQDADASPIDFELIELMFFAYRAFVAEADASLAALTFGRAHHRVLYFVDRAPGLRVSALLETLKITKQSLSRVLKQLIAAGYIVQKEGQNDRRERLLETTEKGHALVHALARRQSARLERALEATDPAGRCALRQFFRAMMEEESGKTRQQTHDGSGSS